MLAADKLLLQSNVKQRSIELREKELKLFNGNFSAVGTQAAIMAGFTLTSFVEIDLPPEKRMAKSLLHFFVTMSICVNFLTVAMVTFVTVWGGGKALRGQDGSMDYAVDEMNNERTFIVRCPPARSLAGRAHDPDTMRVGPASSILLTPPPPLGHPLAVHLVWCGHPRNPRLPFQRCVGAHGVGDRHRRLVHHPDYGLPRHLGGAAHPPEVLSQGR